VPQAPAPAYVFVRNERTGPSKLISKASNTGEVTTLDNPWRCVGDTVFGRGVREDSTATGVNGSQSDNSAEGPAAAYVFVRTDDLGASRRISKLPTPEQAMHLAARVAAVEPRRWWSAHFLRTATPPGG